MTRQLPVTIGLTLALTADVLGDEVFLRSGGRLVGDIVRRDSRQVVLDVDIGHVTVPAGEVAHIVPGLRTPQAVYRDRAAALSPDDADGWLSLALWARAAHLSRPARDAFLRVVQIDPDNAAAHQGLGHVRLADHWMSADDAQRARGFVRYDGRWMTPAERDRRVQEDETRAEHERERRERERSEARTRETESRLRELEARVKEAEARAREAEARADERESQARDRRERDRRRRRGRHDHAFEHETGSLRTETFTVCQVNGQPRFCVPAPCCGGAHLTGHCPLRSRRSIH
jgi:hypothetical protein